MSKFFMLENSMAVIGSNTNLFECNNDGDCPWRLSQCNIMRNPKAKVATVRPRDIRPQASRTLTMQLFE